MDPSVGDAIDGPYRDKIWGSVSFKRLLDVDAINSLVCRVDRQVTRTDCLFNGIYRKVWGNIPVEPLHGQGFKILNGSWF